MTASAVNPKAVISASNHGYPPHKWVVMLLEVEPNASRDSIYSNMEERKIKFNSGSVFVVILPSRTRWLGYTKHKTAAGALRKMVAYDKEDLYYEVIDCHGNHYKRDVNSDNELILTLIPNMKLRYKIKQELAKEQNA